MAVAHKGSISMGMVLIPVGLYKTTVDNDIHFNQLDRESKARIKYKKYCSHCGKEVAAKDIIKGYEYEKDKYVVMTDEELEKIKTKKDKTIHILQFAKMSEVNMIYYEKDYYAIPETGAEKAYELLRQALLAQRGLGIGRVEVVYLCPAHSGTLHRPLIVLHNLRHSCGHTASDELAPVQCRAIVVVGFPLPPCCREQRIHGLRLSAWLGRGVSLAQGLDVARVTVEIALQTARQGQTDIPFQRIPYDELLDTVLTSHDDKTLAVRGSKDVVFGIGVTLGLGVKRAIHEVQRLERFHLGNLVAHHFHVVKLRGYGTRLVLRDGTCRQGRSAKG